MTFFYNENNLSTCVLAWVTPREASHALLEASKPKKAFPFSSVLPNFFTRRAQQKQRNKDEMEVLEEFDCLSLL